MHSQDDAIVGTVFSSFSISIDGGQQKQVSFKSYTEHLAPGRYRVDIVADVHNELGGEYFVDGVYPGFLLEISEKLNHENQLIWMRQY